MKYLISICTGLVLSCLCASAQDANTTPPSTNTTYQLSPTDQKALDEAFDLARVTELWNKPLDWKERGATLPEVVAHIRQNLGKDAPAIEVRGQDSTLTTFTLPQAPLGPTLTSLAELGNYQVWVFPRKLLLATETALTEAERDAIKQRSSGEWKRSEQAGAGYWDANKQVSTVAVPLIGADVKAHLEAKGQLPSPDAKTPRSSNDHFPYEMPLSELSPTAQSILQRLSDINNRRYAPDQKSQALEQSLTVCYNETNGSQTLELRRYDPDKPDNVQRTGQWYSSRPYKMP